MIPETTTGSDSPAAFVFMNPDLTATAHVSETNATEERRSPLALIRAITEKFPRRWAGSADERGAQQWLADYLTPLTDTVALKPFRYSANLYLVISLHFGIGLLGTAVAPWSRTLAAILHLTVAVSYLADSARWGHLLRRLLPHCQSQNLVAVQKATAPLRKRIVLVGHIDAAPAGRMFEGSGAKVAAFWVPWWITECLKPLRWATFGMLMLGVIDIVKMFSPEAWGFPGMYVTFNLLAAGILLSNLEAARAPVVPGANDNLSGCAAVASIAERLRHEKPDDVELVYAMTGCEEAGTGGAYRLAEEMQQAWRREETEIIVLDCLGGGTMTLYVEGEVLPQPSDRTLVQRADKAATTFYGAPLQRYYPPAGATDQIAFAAFGYRGIALGTIDAKVAMPTHYHKMSDTADNIDEPTLNQSIDFATAFCRDLMQH